MAVEKRKSREKAETGRGTEDLLSDVSVMGSEPLAGLPYRLQVYIGLPGLESPSMKPWIRNSLLALCTLLLIAGAAYYWLVIENGMPGAVEFALDIGEVRRLAGDTSGQKPIAIEVEEVGLFKPPASFVVAGDRWEPSDLPVYSYRVVYAQTSVIIDTALNNELAGGNLDSFDAAAFVRIQAAMAQASLILVTHEHVDHIGGLATIPNLAGVLAATKLTREQLANLVAALPAKFPDHALDSYVPLEYVKYGAAAPGIVLIKSPGHTPGSQMVYVQTADGKEFLLIGDVAWHFRNIELERERPRFVTQFTIREDRAAVLGELHALHKLHQDEPRLNIVPGHDGAAVRQLIGAGLMKPKFASAPVDQPN
jgi:glyoxylase-like metal-dependent hydrolase (beta-lactamase superfamily II)